jgi:hypothetical protein
MRSFGKSERLDLARDNPGHRDEATSPDHRTAGALCMLGPQPSSDYLGLFWSCEAVVDYFKHPRFAGRCSRLSWLPGIARRVGTYWGDSLKHFHNRHHPFGHCRNACSPSVSQHRGRFGVEMGNRRIQPYMSFSMVSVQNRCEAEREASTQRRPELTLELALNSI